MGPLKRAIWNTLGLHAVLTICLRFSSISDIACVACCLFLSTGTCHIYIYIHSTSCCFPRCTTKAFGAQKGSLGGAQRVWVQQHEVVRKLRILKGTDFWNTYNSSGSHTDHQQKPVLIRDETVKWLDFGSTPDPVNLQPHPGYVWLKSGYSESIPWQKVRLTKHRNVDLTTVFVNRRMGSSDLKNVSTLPPFHPYISERPFLTVFKK